MHPRAWDRNSRNGSVMTAELQYPEITRAMWDSDIRSSFYFFPLVWGEQGQHRGARVPLRLARTSPTSRHGRTEDTPTSGAKYESETAKQAPIPQIPTLFFLCSSIWSTLGPAILSVGSDTIARVYEFRK